MKHIRLCLSALGLWVFLSLAFAGAPEKTPSARINQTGFFIGLGGAYNFVRTHSNMTGTLHAISGTPPNGVFSGTTGSFNFRDQTFAPEAQIGYFQPFTNSNWLWGLKLLYTKNITNNNTKDSSTYINLTDPIINTRDQVRMNGFPKINHELVLPVFIGHSFMNSFMYLGTGPSLFQIQHTIYTSSDIHSGYYIGTLGNFSNSRWLLGGAVQAGLAYYVNPTWFLNLHYTYATTGKYTLNNSIPFTPKVNGGLNSGSVFFSSSQRLSTQEIAVSINTLFSL